MRAPILQTTTQMSPPSMDARAKAAQAGADAPTPQAAGALHDRYQASWPALNTVELCPAPSPLSVTAPLTIAAWNIERCKRISDSAALLRHAGADIVLATEVDWGMARSGQHHTTRDLAAQLGMGYAFGVEFVELGTGDPYETSLFADVENAHGLHGNAILSRYPLEQVALIPLDDGGYWYRTAPKSDGQLRIGGRMAMAARLTTPDGPLVCVAAHYESESDAKGRDAQTERLLHSVSQIYGDDMACAIGGDFNTAALTGLNRAEVLAGAPAEPCFARFADHGFDWRTFNTGQITTRATPGRPVRYPLQTLDWLFGRGCIGHTPRIWPALSERGAYLSDHELITARVTLTNRTTTP